MYPIRDRNTDENMIDLFMLWTNNCRQYLDDFKHIDILYKQIFVTFCSFTILIEYGFLTKYIYNFIWHDML